MPFVFQDGENSDRIPYFVNIIVGALVGNQGYRKQWLVMNAFPSSDHGDRHRILDSIHHHFLVGLSSIKDNLGLN